MDPTARPDPSVITIFGAGGDLTWRKLVPALYNLFTGGWLPEHFAIIGVDLRELDDDSYGAHLKEHLEPADEGTWNDFARRISYLTADFGDDAAYTRLAETLAAIELEWRVEPSRVFYLAIPPTMIETAVEKLGTTQLCRNAARARIVVEKPFGRDLESARELNRTLTEYFDESQIYRIDHYLGKETVQNILAFRFANAMFEPIWDQRYIDHVQITMAERVGVEHRGGYYDGTGALRDMVQSHLLQVMCLVAMEPPVSFQDEEIRNKTTDVLHAIRPIPPDEAAHHAVRGQYAAGWLEGERVPAYREEPDVAADSDTETFAAVKLFVDNWRWHGVPFYLRTGKRLPIKASEVSIHFRPAPHQIFPSAAVGDWQPNRIVLHIQPDEGIVLRFQAKRPGLKVRLSPVDMRFTYREAFDEVPPEAYQTLLLDVMEGDSTLFKRTDQVEAAWSVMMPILKAWASGTTPEVSTYAAGSWGPEAAEVLIARDGRNWLAPSVGDGETE